MLRPTLAILLFCPCALSQSHGATIPEHTPLAIALDANTPMRAGAELRGHTLYPIYIDNALVLPQNTAVLGRVEALHPDRTRRAHAMLGGDVTPFRTPVVRFTTLRLPDGTTVPLSTTDAAAGAPVYRAVAPERARGGIIGQQFKAGLDAARSDLAYFIAPGKGDRFLQWIYSQLPYHPQRIEKDTAWTVELTAPIDVASHADPVPPLRPRKPHFWEVQPTRPEQPHPGTWRIQANLADSITSESSTRGETIHAIVAEPVLNPDHSLAIPEGATLIGAVTRAKPARWLGRSGVLTFSFSQLQIPDQQTQTVETRLTGADSAQDITLNSEGQAKSRPRDRVTIPLILAVMASSPFDQDSGHYHHAARKNGTAGAAGLGLIGTVVSAAGGSPNVAAGIGFWGAARSVFGRWIARGQTIAFPKDTRIVVETVPRQAKPIHPDSTRDR
jgi:hypothetical protein